MTWKTWLRCAIAVLFASIGLFLTYVSIEGRLSGPGIGEVSVILHGGFIMIGTVLGVACLCIAVMVWLGWKRPKRTFIGLGLALVLPQLAAGIATSSQSRAHAAIFAERQQRLTAHEDKHFAVLADAGTDEAKLNAVFQSYQAFDIYDDAHDYGHAPGDVLFPAVFNVYVAVYTDLKKEQFFGFDRPGHNRREACARFRADFADAFDPARHYARFQRVCGSG